jgi:hypothetical protein
MSYGRKVKIVETIDLPAIPKDVTTAMAIKQTSGSITSGVTANFDIVIPSGELWEINWTNHYGSGADVSLVALYVSPDGGTTWYQFSTTHLDGRQKLYITGGNKIRAALKNAGAASETGVFTIIGRKLRV